MSVAQIHKVAVSPDGLEKVELFGAREGLYGSRLWQRKRKAWRRAAEVCRYDCYVSLCYDAGEQNEWLRRLPPYHLEPMRGLSFERAPLCCISATSRVARFPTAWVLGVGVGLGKMFR